MAQVKAYVETTRLTFRDIQRKTGVNNGTISRWAEARGWTRPPGAWPSTRRPGRRWIPAEIGRVLAQRLRAQAERLVAEIESAPKVDAKKLAEALALLERARAEHQVRRTRKRVPPPDPGPEYDYDSHAALMAGRPLLKKRRRSRRAAAIAGWTKRYARREAERRREGAG